MSLVLDTDIGLGDHVRDEVTGYEGYVVAVAYHLTGCTRFGVRSNDESPANRAEEEWFSEAQLEKTGEEPVEADTVTTSEIGLGDRAADDVTEVEGFATTVTFNLYNCPRAALTVIPDEKNEELHREWFDTPRLEFLGGGIGDDYEELTENDNEGETGSSGANISRSANRG